MGGNIDAHRGRSVNLEKFEKLFHQNAIKLENRGTPLDFSQTPNAPDLPKTPGTTPTPPLTFWAGKEREAQSKNLQSVR